MPRRAPHFLFGKKMGEKNREGARCASGTRISADRAGRRDCGSAPFEPPFQRPAADLPFPRAAGRLNGPSGRKPPADRETFEKPRSRAQLFKRFCAKGNVCALSLISPFFWLLAGLSGHSAANRRQIRETLEKPKEQSSSFSSVSVRWGRAGPFPSPGKQEPCVGLHPEPTACVRKKLSPSPSSQEPGEGPSKKTAACVRGWVQAQTRCATCPPQARELLTAGVPAAGAQARRRYISGTVR